jgi:hypothetical protein
MYQMPLKDEDHHSHDEFYMAVVSTFNLLAKKLFIACKESKIRCFMRSLQEEEGLVFVAHYGNISFCSLLCERVHHTKAFPTWQVASPYQCVL